MLLVWCWADVYFFGASVLTENSLTSFDAYLPALESLYVFLSGTRVATARLSHLGSPWSFMQVSEQEQLEHYPRCCLLDGQAAGTVRVAPCLGSRRLSNAT
jgi:hypothetical protein